MPKFKKIIFDMDGTLVDSFWLTQEAFKMFCPKYNLEMPEDHVIKKASGYSTPEFYEVIFPNDKKEVVWAFGEDVETKELEVLENIGDELLFPDVIQLLDVLIEKGIELHIASTGDIPHVHSCLKKAGIYHKFKSINCNEPDKEEMLKRIIYGDKEEWVMIGDKRKDSSGAKFNGIYSIGAGYGYCFKEDYHTFDEVIFNINDVLKYV